MRDGSSSVFRVIARWSYAKEALPHRLFGQNGPAMLALVTCGGPYSEATGRYEDNIVVHAVPRGYSCMLRRIVRPAGREDLSRRAQSSDG